jgi:hypothetical protein
MPGPFWTTLNKGAFWPVNSGPYRSEYGFQLLENYSKSPGPNLAASYQNRPLARLSPGDNINELVPPWWPLEVRPGGHKADVDLTADATLPVVAKNGRRFR